MLLRDRFRVTAVLLPLVCIALAGCGGDKTYRVSGKVTFKGAPIPVGKIYFMPDGSKGNTGPTGYADIKDGQYDTSWEGGLGAIGGPMVVAIEGQDPAAKLEKADPDVTVKSLFPRYETKADLSKSDATQDFDVPAAAANPPAPKKRNPNDP